MMIATASAATVSRLSLDELTITSELIFRGTVQSQSVYQEQSPYRIFTRTVFSVEEVLKGTHSGPYVLTQLGGTVGEGESRMVQKVPGYARFDEGEKVLLFLERTMTGRLVVTGLSQGKFVLSKNGETWSALQARGDLHHPTNRGVADVHLEGTPRLDRAIPLGQMRQVIAGQPVVRRPLLLKLKTPRTGRVPGAVHPMNRSVQ